MTHIDNTWMDYPILIRPDGSYVIMCHDLPFHVPAEGEYAELHACISVYAGEHPDNVQEDAPPARSLAQELADKHGAIIAEANRAKARLSRIYSRVEESTWPEQEAGARQVLGDQAHTKNIMARLVLTDSTATAAAVELVEQLAAIAGETATAFARRIADNADNAHALAKQIFAEQRTFEAALAKATTLAEVRAVNIRYSVLQATED